MKRGAKLLLVDLTSSNPFINFARKIWFLIPKKIKNKVASDISVENMPRTFPRSRNELVYELEKSGFRVVKEEYKHLFVFIFTNVVKIVPFARYLFSERVLFFLAHIEKHLLNYRLARRFARTAILRSIKQ